MIGQINFIYAEECIYGIKSRIIRDNLGNNASYLGEFIKQVTSVDFPTNLNQFHEDTKHIVPWTLETIVSKHTIYNAYKSFLSKEKQFSLFEWMTSSSKNIHISLGISTSSFKRSNFPKFCPLCSREDLNEHGEAYFHRVHQIPNIKICPDHNCFLAEHKPGFEVGDLKYVCLDRQTVATAETKLNHCATLHQLSVEFKLLLEGISNRDFKERNYKSLIEERGYFNKEYLLRSELTNEFQSYYRDINDEYLRSRVNDSYHWLGSIILRPETISNPFQYLLFDQFVDNLNKRADSRKQHPFGNGPWICYNKVSDHYMKSVITNCLIEVNTTEKITGLFTCDCGMVYSRQFMKMNTGTKEKIRVRSRGKLWMEQFRTLLGSRQSLNKMSKYLGTNISTLKRLISKKPKEGNITRDLIASNREKWIGHLGEFEIEQYSKCRITYPALYKWFTRYDNEWLSTTKNQVSQKQLNLKLDWEKIDLQLREEILDVIKILKKENPKFRISKTVIGKLVNRGKLILSTDLKYLPKTQSILESNTESIDSYQSRRVQNAINELGRSTKALTKSSIIKAAKIKIPSEGILLQINSYLQSQRDRGQI